MAALAAFWAGTPAFADDNRGAENGYSCYHFKQLCRLNLDVNRIAILCAPNRHGTVAVHPDLSPFGLDASTPEPLAVSGWSFVKTTTPTSSGTAIRGVVRQIAEGKLVDIVSPVLLDDQADPVVITPRILPALAGRGATAVRDAIMHTMATLPEQLRQSLTWDPGAEMAQHVHLRIDTGLRVYFCDPHSPWQRGTNENTNGLLRQYFPKGTDLSVYGASDLAAVAHSLNTRPRKTPRLEDTG